MIVGVGLDLTERDRIGTTLQRHGARLEHQVFTAKEWQRSQLASDPVQVLAICFAAKEACLKALGTGWGNGIALSDVELSIDQSKRASITLSAGAATHAAESGVRRIHVAIAAVANAAAALVVLET
jgi:holo-[acyl-carrier protein] synthase